MWIQEERVSMIPLLLLSTLSPNCPPVYLCPLPVMGGEECILEFIFIDIRGAQKCFTVLKESPEMILENLKFNFEFR